MKKTFVFRAVVLFFCAAMFAMACNGVGWAAESPYLYVRHVTSAYITDGRADYKPTAEGMNAPTFHYLYLTVNPEMKGVQKGELILAPSGAAAVDYYTSSGKYIGLSQFSRKKLFMLAHHHKNDFYCVVDGKGNHAEFYGGSETTFSETPFSISLGQTETAGTFSRIRTTERQLSDKCVPYVELVAKGSSVTGLKWCFVDPSASTKALKKQETSQPAKVIKIMIIPDKGKNLFEKEIDQVFADGEIMEGNLTFTSPIKAEKINRVRVDFAYDDARTEYVQTTYTWRFFTQGRK